MILDGNVLQQCPVNAGVPQGSILFPTFFLLHITNLPGDIVCNIAIYTNNTTPQLTFTCSKSAIEILEKGVKYVQS